MKTSVFLLLASLLFFSACQKSVADDTPEPEQPLWPLKVGNSWSYVDRELNEAWQTVDTYSYKFVVTGTATINNKSYYILTTEDYLEDTLSLVRSDANTVYTYTQALRKELPTFKWPVGDGETLFSETDANGKDVAVASTQLFNINTFESYKVTFNYYGGNGTAVTSYSELYFKPGIGITGTRDYTGTESGDSFYQWYDSKLVTYELK